MVHEKRKTRRTSEGPPTPRSIAAARAEQRKQRAAVRKETGLRVNSDGSIDFAPFPDGYSDDEPSLHSQ